jgi:enterochelin esterase family protein
LKTKKVKISYLKSPKPALYWIDCGKDDFLYESVIKMRKDLDAQGFKYTYRECASGHTWTNWRVYLSEFATMIFK